MAYYTDLFSPETYENFSNSDQTISGFRENQRSLAKKIKPGDKLICYVTKISRWVGILEVKSTFFEDDKSIFVKDNDPFIIRFKVKPIIWFPLENSIPIHENIMWKHLSFTKGHDKKGTAWTGRIRGSLGLINEKDGNHIEKTLLKQKNEKKRYLISDDDRKKINTLKVKTTDNKEVTVFVPEKETENHDIDIEQSRESIKIQAILAEIGERMNFKIWLPRGDRNRVLKIWKPIGDNLLNALPMNYDNTTLTTIENIDVLWIKNRSIIRVFEVEHSTAIYSGILRMADLMALQPNLNIKVHIVAPSERRDKVLAEIARPVFTLLDRGPLSQICSFISYESIGELFKEKRIQYMKDDVLEEFSEYLED